MKIEDKYLYRRIQSQGSPADNWLRIIYIGTDWNVALTSEGKEIVFPSDKLDDSWVLIPLDASDLDFRDEVRARRRRATDK